MSLHEPDPYEDFHNWCMENGFRDVAECEPERVDLKRMGEAIENYRKWEKPVEPANPPRDTYLELIKSQAYIIQHQQDLINNYVERNRVLIGALNNSEREREVLEGKLKDCALGKIRSTVEAFIARTGWPRK